MTTEDQDGATYGTGQQAVDEPDRPTQLEKENPRDHVPERVVDTRSGTVLNLDTGDVTRPELVEVSGVRIDVSEFGDGGVYWLQTMYEQWLNAVEWQQSSTFCAHDEGGVNSAIIVDLMRRHYPAYMAGLGWRSREVGRDTDGRPIHRREQFVAWDRGTTLEQWVAWTAATLRWRIKYELERRRVLEIGVSRADVQVTKQACEQCLVACERFLASSERKRLTAV